MPELNNDPRTTNAYAAARARGTADPQLGVPGPAGPPVDLLLQHLAPNEDVRWVSWAFEVREGPVRWWVVALTSTRLLGISPTPTPQVWASPAGSWTAEPLGDDVLLRMPAGVPLRVRGAGLEPTTFGASAGPSTPPVSTAPSAADSLSEVATSLDPGAVGENAVVSSWQQAEALARWHMQKLGFDDAVLTVSGADGGIDVVADEAAAQVKHYANAPIGSPAVQQLRGAATGKDWALFYAWSGYTRSAIDFAETAKVALFRYDDDGTVDPVTSAAQHLMDRVGLDGSPSIDEFELEREAKQMAQEYFDRCTELFFAVVRQAVERRVPGSHLARATDVEMARVKAIIEDIGSRTLPLGEFLDQVERMNDATRRLAADLGVDPGF